METDSLPNPLNDQHNKIMKQVIYCMVVVIFSTGVSSGQKQYSAIVNKDSVRQAERIKMSRMVEYMVENKSFVIEADYVGGKYGNRIPVSSTINFILIDTTQSIFQLGSNGGGPGLNGVGGSTIAGKISKYKVSQKNNKKTDFYFINTSLSTPIGTFDVFINAYGDGNATASIMDNWGNKLNYYGKMVPVQTSRVYKAMPNY